MPGCQSSLHRRNDVAPGNKSRNLTRQSIPVCYRVSMRVKDGDEYAAWRAVLAVRRLPIHKIVMEMDVSRSSCCLERVE